MKSIRRMQGRAGAGWRLALFAVLLAGVAAAAGAQSITLSVVDSSDPPVAVTAYRWLLQEDTTYDIDPASTDPMVQAALSYGFHTSYAPPVAAGDQSSGPIPVPDPSKRYFLSVLPASGYTMSGAPVPAWEAGDPLDRPVTVTVHAHPIPTAQISVLVFHDNYPISNTRDQSEAGLAGFKIVLEDAGGRYGMSAGTQMMDAFGNPLGTVYADDGSIVKMGDGVVTTDANGEALIQNLAPGKYGVSVIPPAGQEWIQTSTIEGTQIVDAWVKAGEPPFFVEFGPPGYHAFFGFVQPTQDPAFFTGSSTISGQVVFLHNSRPPDFTFWPNYPVPGAWVGLNDAPAGTGRAVYAAPTAEDGTFSITGVPPGTYELVVWDENLDVIFDARNVTVTDAGLDLGDVMVFNWFGRLENYVFEDVDGDGFRDADEIGIPEQAVNIRWRDGTMYQSFPTDGEGYVPFDEVFPFFHWLVAEVDFARYKATGVTVTVDNGGQVAAGEVLNPQPQFEADGITPLVNLNTGDNLSRTEIGPVLTQAFQVFMGQTIVAEWGKAPYAPGENGGISGIVYYASTRAENDPALAAAEPWERGIPRVQVNLYRAALDQPGATGDLNGNGIIDNVDNAAIFDFNESGAIELADVDNYPFGWSEGTAPRGDEDFDQDDPDQTLVSDAAALFDAGDALQVAWTDSWDDNLPTGAQGSNGPGFEGLDAFDGLRNFNQMRPGVFDGGYAFNGIPAGTYIVEAKAPPGYEIVKEEDKNVDFGDEYDGVSIPAPGDPTMPMGAPDNPAPTQGALDKRPIAVGDPHLVPPELTLFPGVPAPFAGEDRPLADRKQVKLADGLNAAADFFLFTYVPVASQIVGFVLDDLSNEFDPNAPTFGEKHSPPFLPISLRDWAGNVISYAVTDKYGAYNLLAPSTYTANLPAPSGFSPNMLTVVINDADPENPYGPANPIYSQFSYTFQYMPGATTYLDTPVVPIAAFAGPGQFPVDIEFENGTPVVAQVDGGPYLGSAPGSITIRSLGGAVEVPNPAYDGPDGVNPSTTFRDYGFGSGGTVTVGGVPLALDSWTDDAITATVPAGTPSGQLVVTRSDTGKSSTLGVTVTVGPLGDGPTGAPRQVLRVGAGEAYATIQSAIDAANPGDLILVGPGTYDELVIMHKPVQLQGWGAGAAVINAAQVPHDKILNWRTRVHELWTSGAFDLLPAQALLFTGIEPALAAVEGAGVSVFGLNTTPANGGFAPDPEARIDGFTIQGASTGGAVFVNGYAPYLEVSNNRLRQNNGAQGGGVVVGHPALVLETPDGLVYQDAQNDFIRIHHNQIAGNGGLGGAGGGVALYTGADYYEVTDNLIAGNFNQGHGGGVGHWGRSNGGTIARNRILFNQSFDQGTTVSGGGIFIGGGAALVLGGLTEGAGSVSVEGNLIQGNLGGAGDGGGAKILWTLPEDLIRFANNFVVNNVTGLAGGGLALQDAANVEIVHNTIAHNDSTATAGAAFVGANLTEPLPAGIVVRATGGAFYHPLLDSNIIWENRAFHFQIVSPTEFGLYPDGYWDYGVLPPAAGALVPTGGVETGDAAPPFVADYANGLASAVISQIEGAAGVMPAFDEGGNFIDVRFGPLTAEGSDYHLTAALAGGSSDTADADGDPASGETYVGADLFVDSANLAPVAVNDSYSILLPNSGNPAALVVAAPGLLANDFDPDGGTLAVVPPQLSDPSVGTLALSADGSFTYTAGRRFEGVVSFDYLLSDGSRASVATAVIAVSSRPANSPPAPTAQPIDTLINTDGTTRVLPNDPDVGDTHTYSILGNPRHGTANVSASGTVTYSPDLNYTGTDDVSVRVRDQFNQSGIVSIPISVALNLAPTQDLRVQLPPDNDGVDTDGDGNPDNDNVYVLLGAGDGFSTMADGYQQYIFSFHNLSHLLPPVLPGDPLVRTIPMDMAMHQAMLWAEFPAPTIKVKEGQRLYLNLFNSGMAMRPDLFDPHTVHWHGFPEAAAVFDGVPDASISINMGGNLTYFYDVVWPGTYMYHCHVEATEHMQMGMLGNLYVLPRQDNDVALYPKADGTLYKGFAFNDGDGSTGYDVDFPVQLTGFDSAFHDASLTVQPLPFQLMKDNYPMINGRGYPDTVAPGSLPPALANTFVESASVVNAPAPQPARFYVSGADLVAQSGVYDGLELVFTSGALTGTRTRIASYTVSGPAANRRFQIVPASALASAPAAGDTFAIGKASQNVSSRIEVNQGQRVLLRLSSLDVTRFYTLASTLPMEVVGLNARLLRGPDPDGDGPEVGKNLYYSTNSVTLGGGESVDAIVDTTNVAPGTYLLYTTNLNYLSNNQEDFGGMMTELVVNP